MSELSVTQFILEIRELDDKLSESGSAWVVHVLGTNGDCVIEAAGVASGLPMAIGKAGNAIALLLADEWDMPKAEVSN
jgi:hypothetical protein